MAQFVVYRNAHPATRQETPLLLEVQHDLLSSLGTTVVVPLRPVSAMKGAILRMLTPVIEVEGREHVLVTPEHDDRVYSFPAANCDSNRA